MNFECLCSVTITPDPVLPGVATASYSLIPTSTLPVGGVRVLANGDIFINGGKFSRFDTLEIELRLVQLGCVFSKASVFQEKVALPGYPNDSGGSRNFPVRNTTYAGKRHRFNDVFFSQATWKHSYDVRLRGQPFHIDPEITNTDESLFKSGRKRSH